jgi:hypothetical protein
MMTRATHPPSWRLGRTTHPTHYREHIAMQYKTITLELIQERPELYERLRSSNRLLPSMDAYAIELKAYHESWMQQLSAARPKGDPIQTAAEALEQAIEQLRERLPSESQADEDGPSLDGAMAYLRRHTPTA